jgi:hypothetical protein
VDWVAVFQGIEDSAIGEAMRNSLWAFPVVEALHLVAFAVIGGAVLLLDLRLCGWGLRNQSVQRVAREAQPWLIGSLLVMIATGTVLFISEAMKCYYSQPFWIKMSALSLAMIYTFTLRRVVANADEKKIGPLWGKLAAGVSVALWATVAWGGRWIGFSG